jgi:signal transduction histidine kinase
VNAWFARRLTIISAVVIGGGFVAIVIALALFAFSVYIGELNRNVRDAIVDVSSVLQEGKGPPADARIAAGRLTTHFFSPQMWISVFDQRRRVEIYRYSATMPYAVSVKTRNDPARGYQATTFAARSTMALATVFGLGPQRAAIGPLLVIVRVQDAALVRGVVALLPMLGLALFCAVGISIVFGRVLVLQALRPLNEVTMALERFAAGDLTPRAIPTQAAHQLQNLTHAYNGAIDQMQRAFDERDDAHEAMRQFTADAGHQLRTPLTVIRGFIGVLLRGELRDPADRSEILTTMNGQCMLMGSLIEKLILLDVWEHAGQAAPAEVVDISQLVEDVVLPIAEACPARTVELSVAPGAMARIDPIGCSHALTNLVDNAIKYAPEGAIEVSLDFDDRFIRIVVADQGPGLAADEAQHIFDRFYRGPRRRDVPGSGLGLNIARSAIGRAQGTLVVESAPGQGSRFIISLPVARVEQSGKDQAAKGEYALL